MSEDRSLVGDMITKIKQQRDEIALKIHLGSMEAKDEFENAKAKLNDLEKDYTSVRGAVDESAKSVLESVKLVGEEILSSFDRIRNSLK